MRRFVLLAAILAVIPTGLACHHLAGKCDCWPNTSRCNKYGLFTADPAGGVSVEQQRVEPPAAPMPQPGVQMQPITNFGSGM